MNKLSNSVNQLLQKINPRVFRKVGWVNVYLDLDECETTQKGGYSWTENVPVRIGTKKEGEKLPFNKRLYWVEAEILPIIAYVRAMEMRNIMEDDIYRDIGEAWPIGIFTQSTPVLVELDGEELGSI